MFKQFLSITLNKNIIRCSQICQVLTSMFSLLPCPCTQELHIKEPIPLGSLVGGAFLAQAYKMLDLSLHVPSSQSLKIWGKGILFFKFWNKKTAGELHAKPLILRSMKIFFECMLIKHSSFNADCFHDYWYMFHLISLHLL